MKKKILLTFDVEEFDLPRTYNNPLKKQAEFEISKQGLISLTDLLKEHRINATFFTTTSFVNQYPFLIKEIEQSGHEIGCHGKTHLEPCTIDFIKKAKSEKENILKTKIKGFRAPKFGITTQQISKLAELGFLYDSSTHPIWLPGRYFNFFQKRKIHKIGNITEIPMSTLPINLSLFWLAFKNFPLIYSKIFTKINFIFSNYTMLLFHPWEFANLEKIKIPKYIKRKHSQKLLNLFERYILFCKEKNYSFSTVNDYLKHDLQFIK